MGGFQEEPIAQWERQESGCYRLVWRVHLIPEQNKTGRGIPLRLRGVGGNTLGTCERDMTTTYVSELSKCSWRVHVHSYEIF